MKVSQLSEGSTDENLLPKKSIESARHQSSQEMQQSPNPPAIKSGGAALNYMKVKDLLVGLGLMAEYSVLSPNSPERGHLFELWKILADDD